MENTLPQTPHELEVQYSGQAIEYGTLALLLDAVIQQPVMVMPLERTIRRGSLTVAQWIIHVTTRNHTAGPVHYATFRAAEVVQTQTGLLLTVPYSLKSTLDSERLRHVTLDLQHQLLTCVITLLEQSARVSQVVSPARYRLPDEWVWNARCEETRIQCLEGSWTLVEM